MRERVMDEDFEIFSGIYVRGIGVLCTHEVGVEKGKPVC
jgi:hypothetical protein